MNRFSRGTDADDLGPHLTDPERAGRKDQMAPNRLKAYTHTNINKLVCFHKLIGYITVSEDCHTQLILIWGLSSHIQLKLLHPPECLTRGSPFALQRDLHPYLI